MARKLRKQDRPEATAAAPPRHWRRKLIRRHWRLYVLMSLPFAFLIVFNYVPIVGLQIAFRNYNPVQGMWHSPWTGLEQFRLWVTNPEFWPVIKATLVLSIYSIGVGIPATIVLALALNEVRHRRFKKFVQIGYLFPLFHLVSPPRRYDAARAVAGDGTVTGVG